MKPTEVVSTGDSPPQPPQPGNTRVPLILSFYVLIYYLCVFVHVFVMAHTEPSEDDMLESALSAVWVLEIELGSSDLEASAVSVFSICSHLACPSFSLFHSFCFPSTR